jgi:antitoxin StbD
MAVSMSELKRNPAAVLSGASHRPIAVLKHNRVAFYVLEPRLFKAMMDEFADQELCGRAASRLADKSRAIEVDIDEL